MVETHPAVAIWLWCRKARAATKLEWIYKGAHKDPKLLEELCSILVPQWKASGVAQVIQVLDNIDQPQNDDQLDAIVGWVSGVLLLHPQTGIAILGDASTGSFVLPVDAALSKAFEDFHASESKGDTSITNAK